MQTSTVIDQHADNLKPSSRSWDCWRVNVLRKVVLDAITQFHAWRTCRNQTDNIR